MRASLKLLLLLGRRLLFIQQEPSRADTEGLQHTSAKSRVPSWQCKQNIWKMFSNRTGSSQGRGRWEGLWGFQAINWHDQIRCLHLFFFSSAVFLWLVMELLSSNSCMRLATEKGQHGSERSVGDQVCLLTRVGSSRGQEIGLTLNL